MPTQKNTWPEHPTGAIEMTNALLKMQDSDCKSFDAAVLACWMIRETGAISIMTAAELNQYIRLADRIMNGLMMSTDEPRFSAYDYADGVVNANTTVSLDRLLDLDDPIFEEAMIWLAADKRATYENSEHPALLNINIWV